MSQDWVLEDTVKKLLLFKESEGLSHEILTEFCERIILEDKTEDVNWIKEELIRIFRSTEELASAKNSSLKIEAAKIFVIKNEEDLEKAISAHKSWIGMILNTKSTKIEGRASFENQCLDGMSLRGADLRCSHLVNVSMKNCDLTGANFARSNLNGATLRGAILHGTNFKNAQMLKADLRDAKIHNCNFKNIPVEDLIIDGSTIESVVN